SGRKDRLPQSLLAEGAYALNMILIFGDVSIDQVTDKCTGRVMKDECGTELEVNEEKRMNNIMSFVPMNGGYSTEASKNYNAMVLRGTDPIDITYRAIGEYSIGMQFKGAYYEIKGKGD